MITYIFEVTVCWAVFLGLYALFLKKETFFVINRIYLLTTIIIGLLLPCSDWNLSQTSAPEVVVESLSALQNQYHSIETFISPEVVHTEKAMSNTSTWNPALMVYLIGFAGAFFYFMIGVSKIVTLFLSGEHTKINNHKIILTNKVHAPFAFFDLIYVNKNQIKDADINQILQHENAHISGQHTADIIFISLLKCLFWFHPLVYFYDRSIKLVHEYIADQSVLEKYNLLEYGKLLARQLNPSLEIVLANHFYKTHLKQRFNMMTQNKSQKIRLVKYFSVLPIALFFIVLFNNQSVKSKITPSEFLDQVENITGIDSTVEVLAQKLNKWGLSPTYNYSEVDKKPLSLACPMTSTEENLRCIEQSLIKMIKDNKIYAYGREEKTSVFLSLSLDKYGNLYKVKTDQYESSDLRFLLSNNRNISPFDDWKAAQRKGKNVGVSLQFKFEVTRGKKNGSTTYNKLKKIELIETASKHRSQIEFQNNQVAHAERGIIYIGDMTMVSHTDEFIDPIMITWRNRISNEVDLLRTAEEMPVLEKFQSLNGHEKRREKKSVEELFNFIDKNIIYPKIAKKLDISGQSKVEFIIQKDGSTLPATIKYNNGAKCGEALQKVVDLFNSTHKWKPCYSNGKAKATTVLIPYNFKFNKSGGRKIYRDGYSPLLISYGGQLNSYKDKDRNPVYYVKNLPSPKECQAYPQDSEKFNDCLKPKLFEFFNDIYENHSDYQTLINSKNYEIKFSNSGYPDLANTISATITFKEK